MLKKISMLTLFIWLLSACGAPGTFPAVPTATQPIVEISNTQNPATPETGSQTNPNDLCNNQYFPIVNGASWTYQNTVQSNAPTTAVHSMSANQEGSFTITVQNVDSVFTMDGSCGDDGIVILDAPGISGSYSSEYGASSISTINDEGVTIPDDIQIGDDWSQVISLYAASDGNSSLFATIETTYKAVAYETVTVPAGTFNALKVEQNGSMTMAGTPPIATHGFFWYAAGVGTVKSGLEGTYTSELVSYSIP